MLQLLILSHAVMLVAGLVIGAAWRQGRPRRCRELEASYALERTVARARAGQLTAPGARPPRSQPAPPRPPRP